MFAWQELPALTSVDAALAADAARIHDMRPDNVLVRGRVVRGDVDLALANADVITEIELETGFVEHACIEPEAGFARRVGDRVEVQACTQSPYMDRDDIAKILGIAQDAVRIIPTAVGGGFGAKLDLSVQPFIALAAWHLKRPVRMVYTRPESMMTTTKRHPARIRIKSGCDAPATHSTSLRGSRPTYAAILDSNTYPGASDPCTATILPLRSWIARTCSLPNSS